jgi:hypothetical protein
MYNKMNGLRWGLSLSKRSDLAFLVHRFMKAKRFRLLA